MKEIFVSLHSEATLPRRLFHKEEGHGEVLVPALSIKVTYVWEAIMMKRRTLLAALAIFPAAAFAAPFERRPFGGNPPPRPAAPMPPRPNGFGPGRPPFHAPRPAPAPLHARGFEPRRPPVPAARPVPPPEYRRWEASRRERWWRERGYEAAARRRWENEYRWDAALGAWVRILLGGFG